MVAWPSTCAVSSVGRLFGLVVAAMDEATGPKKKLGQWALDVGYRFVDTAASFGDDESNGSDGGDSSGDSIAVIQPLDTDPAYDDERILVVQTPEHVVEEAFAQSAATDIELHDS